MVLQIITLLVLVAGFTTVILQYKKVMSKLADLESALSTINTELEKVQTEVVSSTAALQAIVDGAGSPDLSAGAQAQLDRLTAVAKKLDDLNADVVVPVVPTA